MHITGLYYTTVYSIISLSLSLYASVGLSICLFTATENKALNYLSGRFPQTYPQSRIAVVG